MVAKHYVLAEETVVWVKELIDSNYALTSATAIALNKEATILAVGAHDGSTTTDYEYVFFLDPGTGDFKYEALRYTLANMYSNTQYDSSAMQFIGK